MIADDFDPCPECGFDINDIDHGRNDRFECFECFIDPTPQHQWEVTTPKDMP
jgi:hypothetical protein